MREDVTVYPTDGAPSFVLGVIGMGLIDGATAALTRQVVMLSSVNQRHCVRDGGYPHSKRCRADSVITDATA